MRRRRAGWPYYHSFSSMGTDPPALLADRLIAIAPGAMSKVFFGTSGSDANDTQVKLVWYYNNVLGRPEKKKIISRKRGYHGVTVAVGQPDRAWPACTTASTCRCRWFLHTSAPHRLLGRASPGETEAEFVAALADRSRRADPRRRARRRSRRSSPSRCRPPAA